jgi:tryptophan synthase alpha subunit
LHPNEVLFTSPEQMEARLREIARKCAGRTYDIGTSGLTPILETHEAFNQQINTWIQITHAVFDDPALNT